MWEDREGRSQGPPQSVGQGCRRGGGREEPTTRPGIHPARPQSEKDFSTLVQPPPPTPGDMSQISELLCTEAEHISSLFPSTQGFGVHRGHLMPHRATLNRIRRCFQAPPALLLSGPQLSPAGRTDVPHSGKEPAGGGRGGVGTDSQPRAGGATQRPRPVTDARSTSGRLQSR